MAEQDVKIIVVTHKDINISVPEGYFPFAVGSEAKVIKEKYPDYLVDYTGDNIAEKHPQYAELTGLYWLWKNNTSDIKGLVHYSRFLYPDKYDNILCREEIKQELENNDMILGNKVSIETVSRMSQLGIAPNFANHFGRDMSALDLVLFYQTIENLYPEFCPSFMKVMSRESVHGNNIMICKQELFDDYCAWAFHILFTAEKEKKIPISRLMGFLAESLLDVYIDYRKLKVKEYPTYVIKHDAEVIRWDKHVKNSLMLTSDELSRYIFQFGDSTNWMRWNYVYSEDLKFLSDGTIGGYSNPNEKFWEIKDNRLFLLNAERKQTSSFPMATYSGYLFGKNFAGMDLFLKIKDFPVRKSEKNRGI